MRTLSATLLAAQKEASVSPLARITLTHGVDKLVLGTAAILSIKHTEDPYTHKAEAVLDNSGGAFTGNDYKGWQVVISYGVVTPSGDEYSGCALLWVVQQELYSARGKLVCRLLMSGIPDMLVEDRASGAYMPADTDSKTVKAIIREILGDSGVTMLACFNHCQPYDIVFDSEDALIGTYQPKDGFRVYMNGSRLSALKRLLDYTQCVMRFGGDGNVHILQATTNGVVYDYEYSLASGHTFFSKAYRNSLVIPNYVIAKSHPGDSPQYSGYASDSESISAFREMRYQKYARLASNAQAVTIATALLAKFQLEAQKGEADVPMNCGAELFDYVKVADERESDYRIGNIGSLTRKYSPGKYTMAFSFGGWLSVRALLSHLEVLSDIGLDFYRLGVKNLYAERIQAGDIDVDTLSAISANIGTITSGFIQAAAIDVAELSAIAANIGTITAGLIKGVTFRIYGDKLEIYKSDGVTLRGYLEGIIGGVALRSVDGGDVTLDSDDDINLDAASGSKVRVNQDMRMNTGCVIEAVGDLEFDPDGNDVIPSSVYHDLGNATYYWDNVEYCDLIDRSPSPHFIPDALAKLKALTTHTTLKKRKGHPDRQIETFERGNLPSEVIVPVTQYDRDRADAIHSAHLARLQSRRSARERCRAKLADPSFAGDRQRLTEKLKEIDASILKMEGRTAQAPQPQPGISMNATIGLLISAVRELTGRVEALEAKLPH